MTRARAVALSGWTAIGATVVALVTGCPPSLEDPARFETGCPAGFSVESMLRDRCGQSSCHGGDPTKLGGGLDLVSAGVAARLVSVASQGCGGTLISTDGPEHSIMLEKVEGTAGCGARMPLGGTPLSGTELTCLQAWIEEKAKAGGGGAPADASSEAPEDASADAQSEPDADETDAADAASDTAGDAVDAEDASELDAGDAADGVDDASDANEANPDAPTDGADAG